MMQGSGKTIQVLESLLTGARITLVTEALRHCANHVLHRGIQTNYYHKITNNLKSHGIFINAFCTMITRSYHNILEGEYDE